MSPSQRKPEHLLGELAEKAIIRDSYGRPATCTICRVGIDTHHIHDEWCPIPRTFAALGWPIPEPEPPSLAATKRLPFDVEVVLP